MQKLAKPSRFVYDKSLNDVIAYHDEGDEPGLCTAGKIFGVAAVLFGIAAGIATGGVAIWLGAYAGASGLFSATIALAC